FAQNARSASSVRNAGTFIFFLLIALPFPPAHVSRRDHPDEVPPDREDDEEPPPRLRAPECVIALLRARVTHVLDDEERLGEKNLLAFPERDACEPPVLGEVPPIQIEADTTTEGRCHDGWIVYRGHIRASTGIEGTPWPAGGRLGATCSQPSLRRRRSDDLSCIARGTLARFLLLLWPGEHS